MSFRDLTDLFLILRNKAISSKQIYSDQNNDDSAALVLNLEDANFDNRVFLKSPPSWANDVDQVQYELIQIGKKMKELAMLHDKYLTRPTLNDDDIKEEKTIDALTQEITKMFNLSQLKIKQIINKKNRAQKSEQLVMTNVVNSLARSLQELTINFRKSQNTYLNRIKSREERSKLPFDSKYEKIENNFMDDYSVKEENESMFKNYDNEFVQFQIVQENRQMIDEREKEILNIVKSIQDLNEIFKDLALMIVDQGTVLDRIDYNIEKTSVSVQQGLGELEKASKYQKKNRKMHCIFILSIIVIVLFILLILVKI